MSRSDLSPCVEYKRYFVKRLNVNVKQYCDKLNISQYVCCSAFSVMATRVATNFLPYVNNSS